MSWSIDGVAPQRYNHDMPTPPTVEHEPPRQRFVIRLAEGGEATLSYTAGQKSWDFYHVFVPSTHRGHGLAAVLVRAGFDYAREHGLRVIPTCPYVRQQVERHAEYRELVD